MTPGLPHGGRPRGSRRAPPAAAAAAALLSLLVVASPGRAQPGPEEPRDWVEHLPNCALAGDAYAQEEHIFYPRPGLPAVVRPGATLWIRVRLPVALTPPPGVQRPRALEGWGATLEGQADRVSAGSRWRYELRVRDVRPLAGSTPVYRVAIALPAYAAPGSYDLTLRTPGTAPFRAPASVRVVLRPPRLARLVAPGLTPSPATSESAAASAQVTTQLTAQVTAQVTDVPSADPLELADGFTDRSLVADPASVDERALRGEAFIAELLRRDVDVFVVHGAALDPWLRARLLSAPGPRVAPASRVPVLDLDAAPPVLLRLDRAELFAPAETCDDPGLPFSEVVRVAPGTLRAEPADSWPLHSEAPPAPWRVVIPARAAGVAFGEDATLLALRPGGSVRAHGAPPSLVALVEGARFPATTPSAASPPACEATLSARRAERAELRVTLPPGARVAFDYAEDRSGWAVESFTRELDLRGRGEPEVSLWCFGAEGASVWRTVRVRREVTGPAGRGCAVCQIGSASGAPPANPGWITLSLSAVWLLLRRRSTLRAPRVRQAHRDALQVAPRSNCS